MIPYIVKDLSQLDTLIDDLNSLDEVLYSVVSSAVRETSNATLDAVRNYPRPAIHPFRWSNDDAKNERMRSAYLAKVARGEVNTDGRRYIRTGRFKDAWHVGTDVGSDSIDAVLSNTMPYASDVVGSLDTSATKLPGHDKTGWYDIAPIAETWIDDVVRNVERRLPLAIIEVLA